MKSKLFYALLFSLIIFASGCSSDSSSSSSSSELVKAANGSAYLGGIFNYNEESPFRHLFPLNVQETVSHRITNNIYEGLVTFAPADLKIEPMLAESWTVSEDGTVYTFKIREGVSFHDDPCFADGKGRMVTAHDFKYCLDLLCSSISDNEGFWVLKDKVLGATEHHAATGKGNTIDGGVKGIKALDDQTLEITLAYPYPDFLMMLATPFTHVFPKEAYAKYGSKGMRTHCVGTGPFKVKRIVENEAVLMLKNDAYWGKDAAGNQLPYLKGIRVSFIKEQKSTLLEFKKGKLDMIYRLPYETVDDVLDENQKLIGDYKDFTLQITNNMAIEYYGFSQLKPPFKDNKKLREAFCYALDREKITDFVVKGMASPGFNGVVPSALKPVTGYDPTQVSGFNYNPEKARKLLAEAGYPNGEGLPKLTLQINTGGGKNTQVADAIQKQLEEVLNVDVEILQLQLAQHYENIETAKTNFWRAGWVADYPSPENFLRLWYGGEIPDDPFSKSYLNTTRYDNAEYNRLFEKSLVEVNDAKRNGMYKRMEEILIEDAVVLPLFTTKEVRLLQPHVRNFPQNAMEFRIFRDVYFVPET